MNDYSEMDDTLRATVESTTIQFFAEHPELDPATTSLEYTPDGLTVTGYITGKWVISAERDDRIDLSTVAYDPATNPYTELFQEEGLKLHRPGKPPQRPTGGPDPAPVGEGIPETALDASGCPHCGLPDPPLGRNGCIERHRRPDWIINVSPGNELCFGGGLWLQPGERCCDPSSPLAPNCASLRKQP